jgi:hypothetical protein
LYKMNVIGKNNNHYSWSSDGKVFVISINLNKDQFVPENFGKYMETFNGSYFYNLNIPNNTKNISPNLKCVPSEEQMTQEDFRNFYKIRKQVAVGEISGEQSQLGIEEISQKLGKTGLVWLTKRVPIYNGTNWESFDDYTTKMLESSDIDPNTRFYKNPIGTSADLLFGDYTTEEMIDWLGLRQ